MKKTISINRTEHSDEEILKALEEAENHGKQALMDNYRTDGPMWCRIRYRLIVEMENGDEVEIYWNPTEEGFKLAEETADESHMCNWEFIDLVEYA